MAAGVALGIALTACSPGPSPSEPIISEAPDVPVEPAPLPIQAPNQLVIGKLGVDTQLTTLGLTDDNEHEVPPDTTPEVAGWYEGGPAPGEIGPAILLGHINGDGKPGIFEKLPDLVVGDEVVVDGKVFKVYETTWAPKNNFPADKVYAKTTEPELRLITCGGDFDQSTGHYKDNFIVYAVMQ